jgi:hypothetical protein
MEFDIIRCPCMSKFSPDPRIDRVVSEIGLNATKLITFCLDAATSAMFYVA